VQISVCMPNAWNIQTSTISLLLLDQFRWNFTWHSLFAFPSWWVNKSLRILKSKPLQLQFQVSAFMHPEGVVNFPEECANLIRFENLTLPSSRAVKECIARTRCRMVRRAGHWRKKCSTISSSSLHSGQMKLSTYFRCLFRAMTPDISVRQKKIFS